MRRALSIMTVSLALIGASALPALAQDLEEWLERASQANYSGRQFTLCDTPDGRLVEIVEVAQRDGILEVRAAFGSAIVSADGVYQRDAEGTMSVTSAEALTGWELADRYHVIFGDADEVLNRPVDMLQIMEGDLLRMRLAFDRVTGAVVQAEVLNADETRYCTSSFLVFEPTAPEITHPSMLAEVIRPALVSDRRLPETPAGFTRKDAYDGPSGSVTGFYSDGIFSFTLVAADRRITVHGVDAAVRAEIGGAFYDRAFTPGQSFHSWETPSGGYVMLGDLPLDLQDAVLGELPKPGKPEFFSRFWRKIFG